MKKLYSLVNTTEKSKKNLYIKGSYEENASGLLCMKQGERADFTTYFNSFSVKKWKRYTTLTEVTLKLQGQGDFAVTFDQLLRGGDIIKIPAIMKDGILEYTFDIQKLNGDILGFSVKCLSEEGVLLEGAWYGDFTNWKEKSIGISITTFKRETYVKKTISVLQDFQKQHSWLDILVVDNGRTLEQVQTSDFRIIHNRNFGGSGGFTRGMIEYVEQGKVDYILLMDDDIVLEPSAIERTHSLLCCLKEVFKDSFLSGAMLSLEKPTIQYENTARWGKIRLHSNGKNYDMTDSTLLVKNEKILRLYNRYGAWWYCVIPCQRIQEIGYPLPLFIKGDDIEYGIRNHREIINMNGIGVWHQSLQSKMSLVVSYYCVRNMLIINHYADGCGKVTFILSIGARIAKQLLQGKKEGLFSFYLALKDYNAGMKGIVAKPSDEKMKILVEMIKQPIPSTLKGDLWREVKKSIKMYTAIHIDYMHFRKEKMQTNQFWKKFIM